MQNNDSNVVRDAGKDSPQTTMKSMNVLRNGPAIEVPHS